MDATQEWLRYVESKAIQQKYNIKGYTTDKEDKKDTESSEQSESDQNL